VTAEPSPQQYPPIGDYAAIGNCRTLALVSRAGSIDWLCLPHFSGPSVFAAMLDAERGGRFAVIPRDVQDVHRMYVHDTNVLCTTYHCSRGVLRLTDFLTAHAGLEATHRLEAQHELVRIVECIEGEVALDAIYAPRPDYARHTPRLQHRGALGWACTYRGMIAFLTSDLGFEAKDPATLAASATLEAGERRQLVFSYSECDIGVVNPLGDAVQQRLDSTVRWWRSWSARSIYEGPYRGPVMRSALALKLLTFSLSGAVIAAATTSLPEGRTGARNWDYRYCWLRDTSLVLQSFLDLGFVSESRAFLGWLLHATRMTQPRLQVLYDVFGETSLTEYELDDLEGYRGIGPVRIGNAAHEQLQLDVYGEVVLTAFDYVERGGALDDYERRLLVGFGRSVCELWRSPDQGIWEIRLPPRHNTYSKLMCWTALDRLVKLDERIGLPIDCGAMRRERDAIRDDIEAHAFDRELMSYVGYYGGKAPDASLLLMARYGYIDAKDERMVGTWRLMERELMHDGLLYRYPPGPSYDGVEGGENLFGICSFWLVDYLARLGEVDRAEVLFEQLLGCANDVGLYAEELDRETKAPLGNFPQAFTHVGLITAALAIAQARAGHREQEIAA
jgi:GH15 family glucan-1,4-alpha-glucosidase